MGLMERRAEEAKLIQKFMNENGFKLGHKKWMTDARNTFENMEAVLNFDVHPVEREVALLQRNDRGWEYIAIPRSYLKFFDLLGYHVDLDAADETGQDISDWWEETL